MIKLILTSLCLTFSITAEASEFYPAPLLHMNNTFSHHVLVAEKSTHTLYLYKNHNSGPVLQKKYPMATGKKAGDKIYQGDHRTPEGVYFFTEFINHKDLMKRIGEQGKIYGVGSFVMDYPNVIDKVKGKTGGGIWLHSTNDENRIEKGLDSRGCLVTHNDMLIELSEYIELFRTPMIVTHELKYLNKKAWSKARQGLNKVISNWAQAWESEDLSKYLSFYHKGEFKDKIRGSYFSFAAYKKSVFSGPGKPIVKVNDLSLMQADDYAVAVFIQDYQSTTIKDLGRKVLYLKRDKFYKWKIVSEQWTKNGIGPGDRSKNVAFRPELRFFKTRNPSQILGDLLKQKNN